MRFRTFPTPALIWSTAATFCFIFPTRLPVSARDAARPQSRWRARGGGRRSGFGNGAIPPTALNAFADLFSQLGPKRELDYSIARNLYHIVKDAGFANPEIEIHQPAESAGDTGLLLKWSVEEAGPAFVNAGLLTSGELEQTLKDMDTAMQDPNVLALAPRMSQVWARKAA